MVRPCVLAAALSAYLGVAPASASPLVLTAAGLTLSVDSASGRVSGVRCGNRELGWAGAAGGFGVRDFAAGTPAEVATGTLAATKTGVTGRLTARQARIEVVPTLRACGTHLAVHATLHDLTGTDRALVLSFRVPINFATGAWQWDDDLRASRAISRAATQPGTMVIAGNDSAGVDTPPLAEGQKYTLIASGYAPVAKGFGRTPAWWGDAEWADYYEGEGYPGGKRVYHEEHPFNDPNCWELLMDGRPMDWLGSADGQNWAPHTYSPDHMYRCEIIGQGKPINLKRLDNMRDGRSGNLQVQLTPLPPGPLPPRRYESVELLSWDGKYSLDRYVSRYPFGNVRCETAGLALAVPLSQPRVHRCSVIQPERDRGYLEVSFELGLSPDFKRSPGSATVDFIVYPTDPRYGLRSAAQRYYDIYPDAFRTAAKRHGIWLLAMDPDAVTEPWDFGFRFHEADTTKEDVLRYDECFGIESFHYIEAGGRWTGFHGHDDTAPSTPMPQDAGMAPKQLTEEWLAHRNDQPTLFDAVAACTAYDRNGDWIWLRWTNEYPGTGPRASHSTGMMNPDIPGGYGRWYLDGISRFLDEAAQRDVPVGGIYQDSISMYIAMFPENYRRELWAYTNVPLTFSHRTGKPVQLHADGMWEFSDELSRDLRRRGKLMMANCYKPADRFFYPFLDMFGTETSGGTGNDASYLRLYAYQKPVSYLDYYMLGSEAHPPPDWFDRERAMNLCLAWGMFPGSADWTPQNAARIAAVRPLYRQFIPLITEVSEAGWQPLTGATCASENTIIERFGDLKTTGRMYLTVMAQEDVKDATVSVTLDAPTLGLDPQQKLLVRELVSGEELALQRTGTAWTVPVKLPAKEQTRVIRLATPQALRALALRQAHDHVGNAAAHLRWALQKAKPEAKAALEQALQRVEALARAEELGPALAGVKVAEWGLSAEDTDICKRQIEAATRALQ